MDEMIFSYNRPANYDGYKTLLYLRMNIRYVISTSASSQSHFTLVIVANT